MQNLIHVRGHGLLVAGPGRLEIGPESAALKDRIEMRGDGRDAALPVESVERLALSNPAELVSVKRG